MSFGIQQSPVLYMVIPCYNEEEVLRVTAQRVLQELRKMVDEGMISSQSKIVFVNDGSRDTTWNILEKLHYENPIYVAVGFSRNYGHQNAIYAGMMYAKDFADAVITMDADLQDDVGAIRKMIENYRQGSDIVYGVRNSRTTDSFFKRTSAQGFYAFMKSMGVEVVYNHADYRLMSKRALEALSDYHEVNLFLRGLIPLIGFKTSTVYYERKERFAGTSKYPLRKMLAFAWQGISSFSIRPIRFVSFLGMLMVMISLVVLVYSLTRFALGYTETGWPSLIVSIWAIGGIQLFAIGIIGEYIGKSYLESKQRPRYIIETILDE